MDIEYTLLDQLNKLVAIDNMISINKDFMLGFILKNSFDISPQTVKDLNGVTQLIMDVINCQIINKNTALEFIVVLSHVSKDFKQHRITSIMDFYEENIGQLVNDPDHLKIRYFQKKRKSSTDQLEEPKIKISKFQMPSILRNQSNLAQCPVCLIEVKHQNVSVLSCGHIIHKQCFEQCMKISILNKRFPLQCPFEQCKLGIQTQDIEQYLSRQLVDKYFQFTLHNFVDKNNKNMGWCPTPGCLNAFEFDQLITNFSCTMCSKSYCLQCRTEKHQDRTCQQNKQMINLSQEDKKFLQFAKGAKYKQCPKCKFWVSKNKGCCHMTCRCKYEFCYVCGKDYGKCNCQNQYQHYYGSNSEESQENEQRQELQREIFQGLGNDSKSYNSQPVGSEVDSSF